MSGKQESDCSTLDGGAETPTSPGTTTELSGSLKVASVVSDADADAGYHTPSNDRKIISSPMSPFDDGYSEDMILSDEELVDYIDYDEDDEAAFHSIHSAIQSTKQLRLSIHEEEEEEDDHDADDESEVDRTENMGRSLAERASLTPPALSDPSSPRTRRHRRSKSHLMRYIRNKVSKSNAETDTEAVAEGNVHDDNIDIEDSSTSDDSSDDESSDSSWNIGGGAWEDHQFKLDSTLYSDIPTLPQHFLGDQGAAQSYLDANLLDRKDELSEAEVANFMTEHGLFLRAVVQLLEERDQVGVEGAMDSPDNIWKQGPLKKRSAGVGRRRRSRPSSKWKVK